MELPQGIENRKKLIEFLKQGAKVEAIKDSANENLKVLRRDAKEVLDIKAVDFNKMLKTWIDNNYPILLAEEAEELSAVMEILSKSILEDKGEDEPDEF